MFCTTHISATKKSQDQDLFLLFKCLIATEKVCLHFHMSTDLIKT